jgi:hypothetical protein
MRTMEQIQASVFRAGPADMQIFVVGPEREKEKGLTNW